MRVVITNNNNEIHTTENELITQEEETIKQIRSLVAPSVKQIVNEFYENKGEPRLHQLEIAFIVSRLPCKILYLIRKYGIENEIVKQEIYNWLTRTKPRKCFSRYTTNHKMNMF